MRLVHQLPELLQVASQQSLGRRPHSIVFRRHVTAALENSVAQFFLELIYLGSRHVAQRLHLRQMLRQDAYAFLTLLAARIVFAGRQFVLHHRVTNNQLDVVRDGQGLRL